MPTEDDRRLSDTILFSVLFLFLIQLLAEFIEGVYAFGLLGTSIPPEIASVLFLFAPALLLIGPRAVGNRSFLALTAVFVACRLGAVLLDTRGRMLVAGIGVAAGLLWLVSLLWRLSRQEDGSASGRLGLGLLGATLLSILFRVLGSGSDISTTGLTQAIGWLLAAIALAPAFRVTAVPAATEPGRASFGRLVALAIGLTSAILLLYLAFASPNVIARWTGASYPAIVATMALALVLFGAVVVFRPAWLNRLSRGALLGWNGLFVLAVVATIWPHQLGFPTDPAAYPFFEPPVSAAWSIPLFLMLLLYPVLFADLALAAREIIAARPSLRALGGAFAVASLFLLVLILSHVFTTVYDYIPVIGPFFRDRFWLVYLVAGLGLLLSLLATRGGLTTWELPRSWGVAGLVVIALVPAGVWFTAARPEAPAPQQPVRVLTYNIQQGYSEAGSRNFAGQLEVIRAVDADIIGLQESDTNRIAGGNADVVRYLADALEMHAYYGPKTVPGTFGIALLSRFPIENPRTFYMASEGEQTATIEARIDTGMTAYTVFVTHLGNGGPIIQQQAILEVVQGKENVILMGDFNFRPETEQYALTTTVLDDAWERPLPGSGEAARPEPGNRIDHIFISPEVVVGDMRYILDPASDHPAATALLEAPITRQ